MESANVGAVLFAKDLIRVASFYVQALGMTCTTRDTYHWALRCCGFELIVHQIPAHLAHEVTIEQPPRRRVAGALRLDYPVRDIVDSRRLAMALGGQIDDTPPGWAGPESEFFLGYDPEGNVFGVSQRGAA